MSRFEPRKRIPDAGGQRKHPRLEGIWLGTTIRGKKKGRYCRWKVVYLWFTLEGSYLWFICIILWFLWWFLWDVVMVLGGVSQLLLGFLLLQYLLLLRAGVSLKPCVPFVCLSMPRDETKLTWFYEGRRFVLFAHLHYTWTEKSGCLELLMSICHWSWRGSLMWSQNLCVSEGPVKVRNFVLTKGVFQFLLGRHSTRLSSRKWLNGSGFKHLMFSGLLGDHPIWLIRWMGWSWQLGN